MGSLVEYIKYNNINKLQIHKQKVLIKDPLLGRSKTRLKRRFMLEKQKEEIRQPLVVVKENATKVGLYLKPFAYVFVTYLCYYI